MSNPKSQEPVILNVDDYVPGRYARSKVLQQLGYRIIEASNGAEALEMVAQHKPILVLLDVNLPDIHGFEVCRRLRADPETAATTIVHISASSILTQHQVHGLDVGADGYIVEPVEPEVLIATVSAFIRTRLAEEKSRRAHEEMRWFSYRVGHDLNEPLRTIALYAELLKSRLGRDQTQEVTGFLDFISDATGRMRALMDGLLQYSEMTAVHGGKIKVDCEKMMVRLLANLDAIVMQSGAIITHDTLPVVMANDQLEHVFQNLVGNAIKYARPGVVPEIHVTSEAESGGCRFIVRDNGMGVPPEYRESVFEIFRRLHGNDIPGTGIGLALSRKIVETLGGRIWVESVAGEGSAFCFTVPGECLAPE